ncbi:hypothetical protein Noda2021_04430 [Candidatus Dependentiae bacterium Noda2021]|nr:hypothetical protein Noda2021_04430 [Candidatus Dependentiae bacterium Noda2021]
MKIRTLARTLVVTFFAQCISLDAAIVVEKLMHHRSGDNKNVLELPLELGKVVFYLSNEPHVTALKEESRNNKKVASFVLPDIALTPALNQMLTSLKQSNSAHYSVNISPVKNPEQGLLLSITYDPNYVTIAHDSFVAIGMQKGLVFYLYNKKLLDTIQNKELPVLQTACLDKKKSSIVIDCGHGGNDSGAVSPSGILEKEVALEIGKKVSQLLTKQGYQVHMTRNSDATVDIDDRTTFANTHNAGLLVSIHANFAGNIKASGVETFFLDGALLKQQDSLQQVMQGYKTQLYKSNYVLSRCLQEKVLSYVKTKNPQVVDRKVKKAVSQLLIGVTMPAALIEVGFLSNLKESYYLKDEEYQNLLSKGIAEGIVSYLTNLC